MILSETVMILSRTSIRGRLYQLVALVVVPFAAYIGLSLYRESQQLIADTQQANRVLAEMTAANLKQSLDEVILMGTELAKRTELSPHWTPECNRLLADFKQLHVGFSAASFTDAEGIHRCSSNAGDKPPAPTVLTDTEWFQRIKAEKRPVISQPYMGRILKTWLVVVAAPVLGVDGNLRGTVNLVLSLDQLGSTLSGVRLPEHAFITVLDRRPACRLRKAARTLPKVDGVWSNRGASRHRAMHTFRSNGFRLRKGETRCRCSGMRRWLARKA